MLSMEAVDHLLLESASVNRDARLVEVRVGPYWSVVQTSCGTGLASTLSSEGHIHGEKPIAGAGSLHRLAPIELAERIRSTSPPEAAVGLAAVNALLGPPEGRMTEHNAADVLAERGRGKRVAMVGRFPFADRLEAACGELWVFERGDGRRPEDLDEDMFEELLPQADVVAVTSTTIINRTLPGILGRVRPDAFLLLLGPSTPLAPRLFGLGVDLLCGTVVVDPEAVLRAVEQGAVTGQITGVRRVSLWPR
ncbi:MAG TPA: DUF364 domain-containing protein [Methylomirabilota bacterium]|nr:DUF364 domain-containing protein [Methylomirabilota bacterium]